MNDFLCLKGFLPPHSFIKFITTFFGHSVNWNKYQGKYLQKPDLTDKVRRECCYRKLVPAHLIKFVTVFTTPTISMVDMDFGPRTGFWTWTRKNVEWHVCGHCPWTVSWNSGNPPTQKARVITSIKLGILREILFKSQCSRSQISHLLVKIFSVKYVVCQGEGYCQILSLTIEWKVWFPSLLTNCSFYWGWGM
jgi:hypothetical protein